MTNYCFTVKTTIIQLSLFCFCSVFEYKEFLSTFFFFYLEKKSSWIHFHCIVDHSDETANFENLIYDCIDEYIGIMFMLMMMMLQNG